ncbi:oligosaccharide flippase family protein [Alteromonas macleodii]|uniref:oligosaccharide flippase family protein n=2 Tax=Alteromonas macleodii TaxID=28108 RepID=UPI00059F3EC4|nr:oligosaccharide flippase family protein [Alteromonas macleodii]
MRNLNSVAKNSAIIGVTRMSARLLGLLGTIFVARILSPEDYAVIAACMVAQDLGLRLQEIGIGQNVTTKKYISDDFLGSLFVVKATIGCLLTISIFFTSNTVSTWLGEPNVSMVLKALSFIFVIQSLSNINLVVETRNQNFSPSMKVTIITKVISVSATLLFALLFENYWALALGMLIAAFVSTLLSYVFSAPYVPRYFSLKEVKSIFSFSKWFTINQLVEFFNAKSGIVVLTKYFEAKIVGFFTIGLEICMLFSLEITKAIDSANQVSLSKLKRSTSESDFSNILLLNLSQTTIIKSFLLLPVYLTFFFHSEFVVLVLLGEQWLELAPYFKYFALTSLVIGLSESFFKPITIYRVPQKLIIISSIILILRLIVLTIAVAYSDPLLIAYGSIVIQLIRLAIFIEILKKLASLRFSSIAKVLTQILPPFLIFLFFNYSFFSISQYSLINIILSNISGIAVFLFFCKAAKGSQFNFIYIKLIEQLRYPSKDVR